MWSHFGPDGSFLKTNGKSLVDTTLNFRLSVHSPLRNSFVLSFLSTRLVCTLHLNAVGPWLPETSTCIPKTIIRPTELAAAAQKPLKWPKICCKSCKMLPNCQAGTKKNDLTTPVDTPHKVRERKLTLILDHFGIGIDKIL